MSRFNLTIIVLFCLLQQTIAQVNYTANSQANKYNDFFLYGSNMGYRGSAWSDEKLADILAGNTQLGIPGVGVNSVRPALYEYFVENWGYDIRVSTFQYYANLGLRDNTVFIGYPSDEHMENKNYCSNAKSKVFANLYEPIWDNGENGTPVNDKNYYALYVYKIAQKYGANVKFWEVWNEPDYTDSKKGDKDPGDTGNWWDNDPEPCDLVNLKAPVQSYVRMLRITYEVVKSVQPDAFVCIGGIGYASFMDAVLRNTDNPDGGKVTTTYPQKGGAWFDCVSFHIYPMYYLDKWNNSIGKMEYFRTSDAAAQTIADRKDKLQELIYKYGYGNQYPDKEFIITECNIPRKSFENMIGSDEAQKNFLIKAAIACQKSDIKALHVYGSYEGTTESAATSPYHLMGLYKYLPEKPYNAIENNSGIAWRTTKRLLGERKYDDSETLQLGLPSEVDGGAFYSDSDKDYIYVLWAKSPGDNEQSSFTYSFPSTWNINEMIYYDWNEKTSTQKGNTIKLTQSPLFIKAKKSNSTSLTTNTIDQSIKIYPNPSSGRQFTVSIENNGTQDFSQINLLNSFGILIKKLIPEQTLQAGKQSFSFDLNLSPGGYFIQWKNGSYLQTKKLLVN